MSSNLTVLGNCYYCEEPVLCAPGQAIRWKRVRRLSEEGVVLDVKEYPTHKACRKRA